MSEVSSPWMRGGRTSQVLVAAKKVAVRGPSTTDSNAPQVEGVLFRAEPFLHHEEGFLPKLLRFGRAESFFQPGRGRTNKNSLLGSTPQYAGDPWPLTSARGHGVSAAKPTWRRLVRARPRGFRQLRAIYRCCGSAGPGVCTHLDRDNRAFPFGSALAASRGTHGPWPQTRDHGLPRQRGRGYLACAEEVGNPKLQSNSLAGRLVQVDMTLRSVAHVGVVFLAALGLIGAGAHAVFTTSTVSLTCNSQSTAHALGASHD